MGGNSTEGGQFRAGPVLAAFERVQREEVSLRPLVPADASDVFAGWTGSFEVSRFLPWVPHTTVEETAIFLEEILKAGKNGSKYHLGVESRNGLVGVVSIGAEERHRFMLGFLTFAAHWGRGYAAAAARLAIDWSFTMNPACERIWGYCDVENIGSRRVMEAVGMRSEGVLRRFAVFPNCSTKPRDVVAYAIVRGG